MDRHRSVEIFGSRGQLKILALLFAVGIVVVVVGLVVVFGGLAFIVGTGDDAGSSGADSSAVTPTPTPDRSANAGDSTPTATPTPSEPTHQVGETFTVGSGEYQVEYTVENVRTTDRIGGEFGAEADGEFVVVELSMENTADESFTVSSNRYQLVDGQDRAYDVDSESVFYLDDPVAFEQLNPGVSTSGAIVFDVPTDQSVRRLQIRPAGAFSSARTHAVVLE